LDHPNYLGGDFYRDPDGTLTWGAKMYIAKMLQNHQKLFGELLKKYSAPIDVEWHPELDTSPEVDAKELKIF
jgi:hypothetical protein